MQLFPIYSTIFFFIVTILSVEGITRNIPVIPSVHESQIIEGQRDINITHQGLHLNIDPRERYIRGHVVTTFQAGETPLTAIQLDLTNDLTIDSILGPDGVILDFTRNEEDHTTDVVLTNPLSPGQSSEITIYYQGIPPENGLGAFVQTSHGTDSIIWTLSEPYGAQDWWPCGQNLTDKIDSLDLWITVPDGYQAASNGLLVSETTDRDWTVFHWKHRYPIATYLVALAVTNYKVHTFDIDLANGPLPIVNYLYPQDYDRHSKQIEAILPGMMQLFERLFIPYPFDKEKYGHAQFGFGGGMEHQTMSFMGSFSYSLVAHELAHQWFGDYVTCGSWQDVWLNEGFADYLTGLTYEHLMENNSWQNYLTSSIERITRSPGGSMFVPDTTNINRIFNSRLSYSKGGMVLHMLRWMVGDDNFYEGMQQYLLDEESQFTFVRTPQLKKHLEDVSGVDLEEFFKDWYLGEGFPSYHIQWRNTDSTLYLRVNQTTSHPSVDFFELPLEIGIYGGDQDSLLRLDVTGKNQEFEFPLNWFIDSIAIDPRHWIISAHNTTEVISSRKDLPVESPYHVFPNPTRNILYIENTAGQTIEKLQLYSLTGQLLKNYNLAIQPGLTKSIDITNRGPGFYYLTIKSQYGMVATHKIIIN